MKILVSFFIVSMLAACGTVSGLGSDIKNASDWTHDQITKPSVDLNKGTK